MASFDLDPADDDDVDTAFAKRLVRASTRTRSEMPILYVDDPNVTDGELQQAAELLGQPVQRRPG
jgi:hypothetical protein